MESALTLLNTILEKSQPHETICLPIHQANLLASLSERELGPLWDAIEREGVERALQEQGLFSRNVVISHSEKCDFAVIR